MKKSLISDIAMKMSYCYLVIPFIIFSAFWMKALYAVPVIVCVLLCILKICIRRPEMSPEIFTKKDYKIFLIAFVIIVLWVCMSGIGGIAYQTEDHQWRNAMFETLVYEPWPIVKTVLKDGVEMTRGFSYYIGFWIPAAAVGKVFGIEAGYFFQIIWAVLGITLFYFMLCKILKKTAVWPLVIFILFSGMDILGYYITGTDMNTITQTTHLEWWASRLQFSSFTTQLFWVFNQAIPAWLATAVIYLQKENKNIILILASTILNCTMPFVGLLPLVIYKIFTHNYDEKQLSGKWWKKFFKDTFSVENIIGGGIIGIISYLYLSKASHHNGGGVFNFANGGWLIWLTFILVEVGVLCIVIYPYQRRKILFCIAFVWCCICALLDVYGGQNFCMRASIPALVLIYIFTIEALTETYTRKRYMSFGIIMVILIIGAVTPMHEIIRNVSETKSRYLSEEISVTADSVGTESVLTNDYESTDIRGNYFFKYLCK